MTYLLSIPYTIWITQLFTGLNLGMIYVLLAIGLSLIFGMMAIVNFAHGAFYMLGAYIGFFVLGMTGNFWIALAVAPLVIGLVGVVIEKNLMRPLHGKDLIYPLLLTFGLSMVLVEIVRIVWGTTGQTFDVPALLAGSVKLGFIHFPSYRIFVILITVLFITMVWLFLEKTNLGLIVRAGTRDSMIVRVLGIDISTIWTLVFGLGTSMAGVAGVLAAPMRGVNPDMGMNMLIEAFVVVTVGGMGSLRGAVLGGIIMGEVVSLTTLIYPVMSDIIIYIFMAVILLVRPSGLFGEPGLFE